MSRYGSCRPLGPLPPLSAAPFSEKLWTGSAGEASSWPSFAPQEARRLHQSRPTWRSCFPLTLSARGVSGPGKCWTSNSRMIVERRRQNHSPFSSYFHTSVPCQELSAASDHFLLNLNSTCALVPVSRRPRGLVPHQSARTTPVRCTGAVPGSMGFPLASENQTPLTEGSADSVCSLGNLTRIGSRRVCPEGLQQPSESPGLSQQVPGRRCWRRGCDSQRSTSVCQAADRCSWWHWIPNWRRFGYFSRCNLSFHYPGSPSAEL